MMVRNRSMWLCTLAATLSGGLLLCINARAECEGAEGGETAYPPENVNYVQGPEENVQAAQPPQMQPMPEEQTMNAPPPAPAPRPPAMRNPAPPAPPAPAPQPGPAAQLPEQNVPNNERPIARGENAPAPQPGRLENSALAPLSFMVGNWAVDMHMSPDAPKAANADLHGFETIRPALNGNAIIGNLDIQGPNNSIFRGHLVITPNKSSEHASANPPPPQPNANAKEQNPQNVSAENGGQAQNTGAQNSYSVFWVDSMGTACFTNDATWDGTNLTINGTTNVNGKQEKVRTTYTRASQDRIDITMDRDSGNGWKNDFKGTLNRAAGPGHRMMQNAQGANRPGEEGPGAPGHAAPPPPHAAPPAPPSGAQAPNAQQPPPPPAPEGQPQQ